MGVDFCLIPAKYYFVVLVLSLITFCSKNHQKPESVSIKHKHLHHAGDGSNSNINCSKVLQSDPYEIQKVKLELLIVRFGKPKINMYKHDLTLPLPS